ncbi:MAG: transposase [Ginsengibacter sp.]
MNKDRKHIRLSNHDYSSDGEYFITICTSNRECFFGKIENDEMILNEIGLVANKYLIEIPNHFSHAQLDEFIVMPNHVHCILAIENKIVAPIGTADVGTSYMMSTIGMHVHNRNEFSKPVKGSVSVIIQQYKAAVKRWCNANAHEYFEWQSRFHDHIIRDAKSYEKIKNYIINNPKNWNDDSLHP